MSEATGTAPTQDATVDTGFDPKAVKQASSNNKRIMATVDEDNEYIVFSFSKAELLRNTGPSFNGKGSGVVIGMDGDFTFDYKGETLEYAASSGWKGVWLSVYRK